MTNVMKNVFLKDIHSLTSIASRHALPEATRRQSNGLQLRPERNTKRGRKKRQLLPPNFSLLATALLNMFFQLVDRVLLTEALLVKAYFGGNQCSEDREV